MPKLMNDGRELRGRKQEREVRIDRRAIDEQARTVDLAFASDAPVERWYGLEVLEMGRGQVRLERLNNGGAVLMDHDTTDQIGVVEEARVDQDRRARALVRFGRGARAEEIFQDVVDGIRSLVSVGYIVHEVTIERGEANAPDTIRVTDWEPLEISFVAVPADASVGVGRDRGGEGDDPEVVDETTLPEPRGSGGQDGGHEMTKKATQAARAAGDDDLVLDESTTVETGEDLGEETRASEPSPERKQVNERIRALGKRFGVDDLAEEHIALDSTVEQVQDAIRAQLAARNAQPLPVAEGGADRGIRIEMPMRYRARPQTMAAFGRDRKDQEERAYRAGMWAKAVIFGDEQAQRWVRDHFNLRALGGGIFTKGGATVPEEMESAIIDLREQYGVARRLCRVVPMMSDTLIVPRVTGNSTASWTGENVTGTAADSSYDNVELVARKLLSLTRVSTELVEDSVIDIAAWLAMDKAWAFAKAEDQAWIDGDGTSTYGGITGMRPKLVDGTHTVGAIDATSGDNTLPEIVAGDLDTVRGTLPQYAMDPVWLCHKTAKNVVFDGITRAAGGNTMETLAGRTYDAYLGDEIVVSQAMPGSVSTDYENTAMLLHGRFDMACTFGDRRGLRVEVLTELYAASDQIGIKTTERVAIVTHDLGDTSVAGPVVGLIGN